MEITILTPEQIRDEFYPKLGTTTESGLYICKSGPVAGAVGIDTLSEPAIDQNKLTVRMRISTPQLDRVNHVVNQDGLRLDYYKDNPTVLFGHGLEGITFPVAISEDSQGNCTISREEDGTYAVAHHMQQNKLSMQMFDLVVQKFIRASSIGVTPVKVGKGYNTLGQEVLFLDETLLNEWSYCVIAVNPGSMIVQKSMQNIKEIFDLQCEAANRILSTNTLDGTSIHPLIRKSLQASVVTKPSTPGIEVKPVEEKRTMKKLTIDEIKKMTPKQIAKSMSILKEYDEESQGMLQAAVEMMPEQTPATSVQDTQITKEMDEEGSEVEVEIDDNTPLGAKVMRSIHESIQNLIEVSTKAMGPVEAPEVKEAATEIINQMRDLAVSLEGVYASKYPDQPALAPAAEEPTEDVVKSFLCGSGRGRDQLQGLTARVDMLAKAVRANGKVTPAQIRMLGQTASDLSRLNMQAKSFKPVAPVAPAVDETKYKQAFEDLHKQFKTLQETLAQMPMPLAK